MNRKTRSTVDASSVGQARRDVVEQRATLARLEADTAAAQSALAALQEGAGAAVLDDPEAAGRLAREMQELRDRIDMTGRAVEAQRPRVSAAEAAYLLAEADTLDKAAERPHQALQRHQDRTAELLRQLEEHEGRYVPEHLLIEEQLRHSADRFNQSWELPKSDTLETAVLEAELPGMLLREMAAGNDPQALLDRRVGADGRIAGRLPREYYPDCVWGPDAVVPAPAYLRAAETATARLAAMRESTIPGARAHIAALEADLDEAKVNGNVRELHPGPPGPAGLGGRTLTDKLAIAKEKLQAHLEEEARLAEELAALTGRVVEPTVGAGEDLSAGVA